MVNDSQQEDWFHTCHRTQTGNSMQSKRITEFLEPEIWNFFGLEPYHPQASISLK